jgi:hypothetical protein
MINGYEAMPSIAIEPIGSAPTFSFDLNAGTVPGGVPDEEPCSISGLVDQIRKKTIYGLSRIPIRQLLRRRQTLLEYSVKIRCYL